MRVFYDAVQPGNIPSTAAGVAGYVDGRYAWSAADWARFPNAVHVRIACFARTNDGHVLDVETGDATPTQAPGWVRMRRQAGVDPTVYCSLAWWPSVRAAFIAQGVPEPHYWIAAYPGNGPRLYAGAVAHQYANPGPYDLSVVADYWPGVDIVPTANVIATTPAALASTPAPLTDTTPAPAPDLEDDMIADITWYYTEVIGRTSPPSIDEILGAAQAAGHGVALVDYFLGAPAEGVSITKAYHDYLHRDPSATELTLWPGKTVGEVRGAVRNSPEAKALQG